jgi:hypothetical protein
MEKKVKMGLIVGSIVLLIVIFLVVRVNNKNKDSEKLIPEPAFRAEEFSAPTQNANDQVLNLNAEGYVLVSDMVGRWMINNPEQSQGLVLYTNGTAESINSLDIKYTKWRLDGYKLFLTAEGIQEEIDFIIDFVGVESLRLRRGEKVIEYTAVRG